MPDENKTDLKPIKISDKANRAIEAYLGWQRGIGNDPLKQDVLEEAVLFFVNSNMPAQLRKVFNLAGDEKKTVSKDAVPAR